MKLRFTLMSLAFLMVVSCGENKTDVTDSQERVEQVRTEVLKTSVVSRNVEYSSTLEGYETMNVSPSVTGNIEQIYVEVGDKVKPGDVLLRMDQRQWRNAKLQFANAQKEMARIEALYETEAISRQTYDQTKLSFDTAYESLMFLDSNTVVKAQLAGVVSARNFEDGEMYNGSPILTITQISTLKALVGIPESYFPVVKKGMKVNLVSEIYPGKEFPATVEIVYPTIDASSHTFRIKLRIPNGTDLLRPGMYVKARMSMGDVETIVVPYQAVLKLIGSNERYIFLNRNGVAEQVFVKMGERYNEYVEIISDEVKPGDEIVTVGQAKLIDGVKLDVVK